jgi:hypothetical protein
MRWKVFSFWLRDRVWPMVEAPPEKPEATAFEWPLGRPVKADTIEAAYNLLKEDLKADDDRAKVVESKLLSISSIVPVAMTITVAMVTFLTSGRVSQFNRTSIFIVGFVGGYVALQFLRASLAAVKGLWRRSYSHIKLEEIAPQPNESKEKYLHRMCAHMADVLNSNREVVNEKVSQLALGHESIKNAIWGLLILLLVILTIVVTGSQP